MDIRIQRLAKLLVHYSNKIKKGDRVRISGDIEALPLLREIYEECVKAGALFVDGVTLGCPGDFTNIFYEHATEEQLTFTTHEWEIPYMEMTDATFSVYADENPVSGSNIDPEKQKIAARPDRKLDDLWVKRTAEGLLRWVITCYPCNGYAIMAGMSLREYEDFVYKACFCDRDDPVAEWQKIAKFNQRLADYLSDKKVLRFISEDSNISMSVEGRTWIPCSGEDNMPDGEVFTAPVEDSVNGVVRYSFPAICSGREVDGVELTFENGRVTWFNAEKGKDFLAEMLDIDEGAKTLGEVGIATNFGIQQHTKEILFDEKIGGTFHLALGAGYPESGSTNQSSLHWDMICDLREEGAMTADGEAFFIDGEFIEKLR